MSLPKYVVNFEELAQILAKAINENKSKELIGEQKSTGVSIYTNDIETIERKIHINEKKFFIVGIRFGVKDVRNIGYKDTWDLYLNNEKVFEDVYIKEMYEYKTFAKKQMWQTPVDIKIVHHNTTGIEKVLWWDIDYAIVD